LSKTHSVLAHNPTETQAAARDLAQDLRGGEVLVLTGDLGAGKTEFVKGLARALGYLPPVGSPTFTLIHEYRGGRVTLFHMDFYRLEAESELDELALDDYFRQDAVCAIEWGEKFPERLPPSVIQVRFSIVREKDRLIQW
jgi:tRNA threonylcarbamoyladenosine biosynthesis protein TsaE